MAAKLGKSFIFDMNPDKFVRMIRELKVLNTVRDKRIGIPITFTQYPFSKFPQPRWAYILITENFKFSRSLEIFNFQDGNRRRNRDFVIQTDKSDSWRAE